MDIIKLLNQEYTLTQLFLGKDMYEAGGIPQRYRNMGFTQVGRKMKSTRPEKKWMVLAKKGDKYKVVHGGFKGMSDYTKHKDKKRRKRFWQRMGGFNSAKAKDPFSPLYWHKRFGTWKEGGKVLLAPNGKKSNLTPGQYNLVRTPEFKAWFGDWEKLAKLLVNDPGVDEVTLGNFSKDVSKVVDENGEPLVVYHGTSFNWSEFDIKKTNPLNKFGQGFYTTNSFIDANIHYKGYGKDIKLNIEKIARELTEKDIDEKRIHHDNAEHTYNKYIKVLKNKYKRGKENIIKQVFLSIKNPIVFEYSYIDEPSELSGASIDFGEHSESFEKFWSAMEKISDKYKGDKEYGVDVTAIIEELQEYCEQQGISRLRLDTLWEQLLTNQYLIEEMSIGNDYLDNQINNYVRDVFLELGYDGIIDEDVMNRFRDMFENDEDEFDDVDMVKHFVAYNPTQIKLADGTNTTFDPNNPDIRYEKGGEMKVMRSKKANLKNSDYKIEYKGRVFYAVSSKWSGAWNLQYEDGGEPTDSFSSFSDLKDFIERLVDREEKSNEQNNNIFDPNNPDIRYGEGGELKNYSFKKISDNYQIFAVETENTNQLSRIFVRISNHYENQAFDGRVFGVGEVMDWWAEWSKGRGVVDSYYDFWFGFNIPDHAFADFLAGEFDPLTLEEKWLIDRMMTRIDLDRPFYIIGYAKGWDETRQHEIAHALYYLSPEYRKRVDRVVSEIPKADISVIDEFLRDRPYSPDVYDDERQAYILADKEFLKEQGGWTDGYEKYRKRLKTIYDEYTG